jgi:hypothetical protein
LILIYALPIFFVLVTSWTMGAFGKAIATRDKVLSLTACLIIPYVSAVILFYGTCMYDRICL